MRFNVQMKNKNKLEHNNKKLIKLYTGFNRGIDTSIYQISINMRSGLPVFEILNLSARSNRMFLLKLKSIFNYLGYKFPFGTITICLQKINNSSQALINSGEFKYDIEKMEFPIAIALLCASNQIQIPALNRCLIFGSLDLEGNIYGTKNPRSLIKKALEYKITRFFLPMMNKKHGASFKNKARFAFLENLDDLSELKEYRNPINNTIPLNDVSKDYKIMENPKCFTSLSQETELENYNLTHVDYRGLLLLAGNITLYFTVLPDVVKQCLLSDLGGYCRSRVMKNLGKLNK